MEAVAQMKEGGACDLMERLACHPEFALTRQEVDELLDPALYTGRAARQVEAFLANVSALTSTAVRNAVEIDL